MKKYQCIFSILLSIILMTTVTHPVYSIPISKEDSIITADHTDDYANNSKEAQSISTSGETSGVIETNGDVDYFVFKISEACMININSSGTTDMYGTLMSEDGSILSEDDDSAGYRNFLISTKLDVGTYYLAVRHYYSDQTGKYTICLNTATLEDDIGNDLKTATDYKLGSTESAAINYYGDIDTFKINIDTNGRYTFLTHGFTDTYGTLLDSKGNKIIEDDDSGDNKNFTFSKVLDIGTYYLQIKDFYSNRTGSYSIIASKDEQDDYGNTVDTSASLEFGKDKIGKIDYAEDVDVFKFSLEKEGIVILTTTGKTDTLGILMDMNGKEISKNDDTGLLKNFSITKYLKPGVYYLSVQNSNPTLTGEYTIVTEIRDSQDDDYGNDTKTAQVVKLNTELPGHFSFEGDLDYFTFTLEKKTEVELKTTGITDTFGSLIDSNGNTLLYDDDEGDGKNFLIDTTLEKGTYYIKVNDFYPEQLGFYTLYVNDKNTVSEVSTTATTEPEPVR